MPAVSQSQQKLMAQAYQVKKFKLSGGDEGTDPKEIDTEYRDQISDLADSMSKAELKRFAETKIKDLPKKKVKENLTGFLSGGPFPQFYSYVSNVAPMLPYANKDNKDPLVKKFMKFIEDEEEEVTESGVSSVPVPPGTPATVNNTSGVGNVVMPTLGALGSGDRFDNNIDNKEDKVGVMSYEEYKKWVQRWMKKNSKMK
jgi:hypothetical protein